MHKNKKDATKMIEKVFSECKNLLGLSAAMINFRHLMLKVQKGIKRFLLFRYIRLLAVNILIEEAIAKYEKKKKKGKKKNKEGEKSEKGEKVKKKKIKEDVNFFKALKLSK